MIYTAETLLWPRLIHAMPQPQGKTALEGLMRDGALLRVNHDRGSLQLSAGDMTEADYRAVVGTGERPGIPGLQAALERAKTTAHPWVPGVMAAYLDLKGRCEKGKGVLQRLIPTQDLVQIKPALTTLIDRNRQAASLAGALMLGGYVAYCEYASVHACEYMDLVNLANRTRVPYDLDSSVHWPVETPDGRIVVTDYSGVAVPDEVTVPFTVLGDAMVLYDSQTNRWVKEAV